MTWPLARLDEIAEVRLGRQRSPKNHAGTHMRPYLRAANVGWDGLKLDDVKQMNFTDTELATYALRPGDLLLSEASGSAAEVGKPALWSGEITDCAFQNTLIRVRPGPNVNSQYLLHFFKHEAAGGAFARGSRGVGIHHLGRAAVAEWKIPLPPLDEQRRIVAILDHGDRLGDQCDNALARLSQLRGALFQRMFGQRLDEWPSHRLGELVADSRLGLVRAASEQGPDRPHTYIKMDAISRTGELLPENFTAVDATDGERALASVENGDLLFNTRNTRELVGKTAVFRGSPVVFNNNLMRLRFADAVISDYVHAYLWSRDGIAQLEARKAGTTSIFAIYAKSLATVEIPLPPRALQDAFSRTLAAVAEQHGRLALRKKYVAGLRGVVQAGAFSDQLSA